MKTVCAVMLVLFTTAGCAATGSFLSDQRLENSSSAAPAPDFAAPAESFPSPDQDMSPRVVLPATGGMPVIGIPLGGDMYLPMTGGMPVMGIPTGP